MKVQIRINNNTLGKSGLTIQVKILQAMLDAGYTYKDGTLDCKYCDEFHFRVYTYTPGKKDILFKKHEYWMPDWKFRRALLSINF